MRGGRQPRGWPAPSLCSCPWRPSRGGRGEQARPWMETEARRSGLSSPGEQSGTVPSIRAQSAQLGSPPARDFAAGDPRPVSYERASGRKLLGPHATSSTATSSTARGPFGYPRSCWGHPLLCPASAHSPLRLHPPGPPGPSQPPVLRPPAPPNTCCGAAGKRVYHFLFCAPHGLNLASNHILGASPTLTL